MNGRLILAVVAVLASGCGNTSVNVGGRTLDPLSADLVQYGGYTFVTVSDIPEYCQKLRAAVIQANCDSSKITADAYGSSGITALQFWIQGANEGARVPVVGMGASSGTYNQSANAFFVDSPGPANLAYTATASSGTVTLEAFRSAQHISGTYELWFNGEREQGHFSAPYCNAYDSCRFQ
jgi:hypothetical protein